MIQSGIDVKLFEEEKEFQEIIKEYNLHQVAKEKKLMILSQNAFEKHSVAIVSKKYEKLITSVTNKIRMKLPPEFKTTLKKKQEKFKSKERWITEESNQ